jgi:hypothetical protein
MVDRSPDFLLRIGNLKRDLSDILEKCKYYFCRVIGANYSHRVPHTKGYGGYLTYFPDIDQLMVVTKDPQRILPSTPHNLSVMIGSDSNDENQKLLEEFAKEIGIELESLPKNPEARRFYRDGRLSFMGMLLIVREQKGGIFQRLQGHSRAPSPHP